MCAEASPNVTPTASSILLALLYFWVAAFAAGFAVILRESRWSVDLTFLIAVCAVAMGWSLLRIRRLVFLVLPIIVIALLILMNNERIFSPSKFHEPRTATGTDWYRGLEHLDEAFIWLWANGIFWLTGFGVLATLIYLASEWKRFFGEQPASQRTRNVLLASEVTFLVLSIPIIYIADFYWPKRALQAREAYLVKREVERVEWAEQDKQKELAKQKHIERLHQELRKAIADLKTAAESRDREAAKAASAIIVDQDYEFGVGDDISEWKRELLKAGEQGLLFLAEEIIAVRIDSWQILKTLEEFELTPEVRLRVEIARRRHTIAEMYKKVPAYSTNLGWLEAHRDGKQIVAWLIDAIGDREHTTPRERIDLAHALEEAAEFGEYDARAAIKILQEIVDGDDDKGVKEAAASALAKAKLDREEHWEQRRREN